MTARLAGRIDSRFCPECREWYEVEVGLATNAQVYCTTECRIDARNRRRRRRARAASAIPVAEQVRRWDLRKDLKRKDAI